MRDVLKLYRSLTSDIPIQPRICEITTFDPKLHKTEWLELNNKIFINHPDQGNWARVDLENRIVEPWFDPEGFFIATKNKKMLGFCWTKIHRNLSNHDTIGEIYVIGVDPESKNKGIGKVLASTALTYLKLKAVSQVMLYVDSDNFPALKFYRSLNFN